MSNKCVFLHFSQAQSPFFGFTFRRLPSEQLYWPPGTGLDLVRYEMAQPEVIHIADENLGQHALSCSSIIEHFRAILLEAMREELFAKHFFAFPFKKRAIHKAAGEGCNFSANELDKMGNSHTRGNTVRSKY